MTIQDKLTIRFLSRRFGKTFPASSSDYINLMQLPYFQEWKDRLTSDDTRSMDDESLRIYLSLRWYFVISTAQ